MNDDGKKRGELLKNPAASMPAFLAGGGEMGARIAAYDWAATPLGPIEAWSESLRTIVAYLVHCPIPLVMLWGEDGIMIYNDGYAVFAGDNHPGILGSKVREAWPEVADFNDNVMKVGLAGGRLAYKDHLLRLNRTGRFEDVWMNLDYSPVYENGKPAGVMAIVVETTESVKAAAALREFSETLEAKVTERAAALERSEIQFRLLVQGVTDYAIFMLDTDGRVSSWNAGAERIKGYAPEEIIGQHFSSFYAPEDRARGEPERALQAARSAGRFAAEGWRVRKDGSRFHASVVIDAIHDDDGTLIGFAKITRDVTEREEAQRELEIAREALFQSQKMEAIGQLTGGVAHDFNNLLMAIMSGLMLLRKRLPDEPQFSRLIENSLQAAERGAVLTQRMLAFARRQELVTERIAIPELVHGMIGLMQRTIGPSWIIETDLPDDLPAVSADANQLEMALLNLAVNARDAMPSGGTIRIDASEHLLTDGAVHGLGAGRYVRLSVCDEGSGMDAETLMRATEPFFTTKGVGKGTGLGLSMIHGFAQQIGGALQLESQIGKGTSARIWLPLATGDQSRDVPSHRMAEPVEAGQSALHILVVDDDSLVLMNTAALLEDLGHEAIEATSGEEALAYLREHPEVDLIITDQAMPGMTGSELIEAARMLNPSLPIVLATGYGELPADGELRAQRLAKPFGQADLRRAVTAALSDGADSSLPVLD